MANSIPTILYNILYTKEESLQALAPTLPQGLADAISRCLEKDIAKRLPNLVPLISAIEDYVLELGIRNPTDEISKYVGSHTTTGFVNFVRRLVTYHVRKSDESSQAGNRLKSEAHLKEALKYDPGNQEIGERLKAISGPGQKPAAPDAASAPPKAAPQTPAAARAPARKPAKSRRTLLLATGALAAAALLTAAVALVMRGSAGSSTPPSTVSRTDTARAVPTPADTAVRATAASADSTPDTPMVAVATGPVPAKTAASAASGTPVSKAKTPVVRPKPLEGTLRLAVLPAGAEVLVDGHRVTDSERNAGVRLKPGQHRVVCRAQGYVQRTEAVDVPANGTASIHISLQPAQQAATSAVGAVHVFSSPWAELYVDGARKGIAPTKTPIVLPAGSHTVVLTRAGFREYRQNVTVAEGDTARLRVTLEAAPGTP
jgi:hypothetical protein